MPIPPDFVFVRRVGEEIQALVKGSQLYFVTYNVNSGVYKCGCKDFIYRKRPCKHIQKLGDYLMSEEGVKLLGE